MLVSKGLQMKIIKEAKRIENKFNSLIESIPTSFPLQREKLEAPIQKGVYIIQSRKGSVLHVGNTPRAKNGISQRLKNHMAGSSSFTNAYFDGDGSKLRGDYQFKYLIVDDARERALLEAYTIGRLCPKHIGTGR